VLLRREGQAPVVSASLNQLLKPLPCLSDNSV
jgi:hypothetical protein